MSVREEIEREGEINMVGIELDVSEKNRLEKKKEEEEMRISEEIENI